MRHGAKMRPITRCCALACVVCGALGCSTVRSEQPIGNEPARLTAEEWDGEWFNPDGVMVLKVVDGAEGRLAAASVEDRDGKLVLESIEVLLRAHGGWLIANVVEPPEESEDEEERGPDLYSFALVRKEEARILVWFPSAESFKTQVTAGTLPGRVIQDDVILGKLSPEHLDRIAAGEAGDLYDWAEPQVWFRFGWQTP